MERYHADNADAAQEVEGVISLFHFLPNKYSFNNGLTRKA